MSSFSSSSSLTDVLDAVAAEGVSSFTIGAGDCGCSAEDVGGWAKLGDGSGARLWNSVRREPGAWPLKKLSGVASAERLRARIACLFKLFKSSPAFGKDHGTNLAFLFGELLPLDG